MHRYLIFVTHTATLLPRADSHRRQSGECHNIPVIRGGCRFNGSTHGDGTVDPSTNGFKMRPS